MSGVETNGRIDDNIDILITSFLETESIRELKGMEREIFGALKGLKATLSGRYELSLL